ncbi:MAG: hypothetical protein LBM92_05410, partial [Opitutaceae bacterium]|nr:hypothetical protein [Opitutaceae bacterium]
TAARAIAINAVHGDITLNGAVTNATGGITLAAPSGGITSTAQITSATGALVATAAGGIALAGVLTSSSQSYTGFSFTGTGLLQTTDATTGDMLFNIANGTELSGANGRIDSARSLTVNTGSLATAGAANTLTAARAIAITAATGNITLNGAVTNTTGGITLAATNGGITSTAQITSATGALIVTAEGGIALAGVLTSSSQSYTGYNFTGTGLLKTTAAATGDIVFDIGSGAELSGADGRVESAGALTVRTESFATDSAANTLAAARAIAISAEDGDITLHGAVTNATGDITLAATIGVEATAAISAAGGSVDILAGGGGISLVSVASSGSQRHTSESGGITVTGLLNAGGDIVLSSEGGAVVFSENGAINTGGLLAAGASSFTTAGAANTITAERDVAITTSSGDITLNGALTSRTGNIALGATHGGSISVVDVASLGQQTYTTTGGDVTVNGLLKPSASGASVVFSTTDSGIAGMTTIKSGAAVELADAELLVDGGFTLEAGGSVKARSGVTIGAAGREVILNALLGGAAGALDTISITGAGFISTVGIETSGTQSFATNGGDMEATGLLRSAASGPAITFMTDGADDPANADMTTQVGMATIRAGGGIETTAGHISAIGGLTMEENTTLRVAGAGGVEIDGRGRAAAFGIALGGAGNELSQINITNAGDILLTGVTTTGNQSYHFDDGAAMRLDGALVAGGAGSISISNSRTGHAEWATIFSTAPGGIRIETAGGNITVSEFNTMLAFDYGHPDSTAGDIFINSAAGAVSVSNMIASHKIELIASPMPGMGITLTGDHYQAGVIYAYAIYSGAQAFIPVSSFFVPNNPTVVITGKNEARMPWLPQIRLYAYFDGVVSEETGRTSSLLFQPMGPPPGSIFSELYPGSQYAGWLVASAEAIQNTVASNPYERSLELAALEENMKAALAAFMSDTDTANRISGATKDELVSVGIFSRRPDTSEYVSRDYYRGLFQQIIRSEERAPEMYQVVDGRISEQNARRAVELYHRTFMRAGDDGKLVSRVPEIQAALQSAIRSFRSENRAASPSEFAGYLQKRAGDNADAALVREFIDGTRRLFAHIDNIGLTRNEVSAAKSVLIRPLRAPGLPAGAIRDLVEPPAPAAAESAATTAQAIPPPPPSATALTLSQNITAY